jgi:hypothetical protein
MRTTRWITRAVVGTVAALSLGALHAEPGMAVIGGTSEQQAMGRWAIGRFAAADLTLPPLEIRFHADQRSCQGRLGYYLDGVADVCGTHTDLMAHRLMLHELAHGWAEANLTSDLRARFLELRGLRTWNDNGVDWNQRGFEHAAEIMSWALADQGTGILSPSLPNNSPRELADAYELLTGNPMPRPSNPVPNPLIDD